ncbi:Protein CBR-NLP-37 [Aphelenchoides fujianensis]|nr:Protein CBR-NLP-37 [Aphelenchoides fujianensis]
MNGSGLTVGVLLVCVLLVADGLEFKTADDVAGDFLLRQFVDRFQPAIIIRPSFRRIRRFDYTYGNDDEQDSTPRLKRNNAEVVNHIIKNFGALDRLGDVGK